MEMGQRDNIERIAPEGEIYLCPACQYTDGFHVSFKMQGDTGTAEVILICPNCHRRFRIGCRVDLEQG